MVIPVWLSTRQSERPVHGHPQGNPQGNPQPRFRWILRGLANASDSRRLHGGSQGIMHPPEG